MTAQDRQRSPHSPFAKLVSTTLPSLTGSTARDSSIGGGQPNATRRRAARRASSRASAFTAPAVASAPLGTLASASASASEHSTTFCLSSNRRNASASSVRDALLSARLERSRQDEEQYLRGVGSGRLSLAVCQCNEQSRDRNARMRRPQSRQYPGPSGIPDSGDGDRVRPVLLFPARLEVMRRACEVVVRVSSVVFSTRTRALCMWLQSTLCIDNVTSS